VEAAVLGTGERAAGGVAVRRCKAGTVAESRGDIAREVSGTFSGGARAIGGKGAALPPMVCSDGSSGGAFAIGGGESARESPGEIASGVPRVDAPPPGFGSVQSADQIESSGAVELPPSESPTKKIMQAGEAGGGT